MMQREFLESDISGLLPLFSATYGGGLGEDVRSRLIGPNHVVAVDKGHPTTPPPPHP